MIEQPSKTSDQSNAALSMLGDRLREYLIYVAWSQALVATLGSLFFSEVMGFLPCILCWYQRILMYPLVIVLGVGILLRDNRVRSYVLPLSILGMGIGLYHNLLYYGAIPEEFHICTTGIPCETRWIEWLGFVGIPLLSFTAFTVITLAMFWHKPVEDGEVLDSETTHRKPESLLKGISGLIVLGYVLVIVIGVLSRLMPSTQPANSFEPSSSNLITPEIAEVLTPDAAASYSPDLIAQGQQVFSRQCSACHGQNAQGVPNLGLPLVDSQFINERTDAELVEFITTGRVPSDPQSQTGITMPGKGGNPALTNTEILAVIAYLRSL